MGKAKLLGKNDRLLTRLWRLSKVSIKDKILARVATTYREKSLEPTSKLSDLGFLDQLIKQDTKKFSQEFDSLIASAVIENPLDSPKATKAGEGSSTSSSLVKGEELLA